MCEQGVYEGVFALNQAPREFISKSIFGGRVMSNRNKKYDLSNGFFADTDAVSLYPSSMERLKGILKGYPQILTKEQLNMKFLSSKEIDGYWIDVKILELSDNLDFPVIAMRSKNGLQYDSK